ERRRVVSCAIDSPRYSVTTEAELPRNFSAISATAVTLSGRAIGVPPLGCRLVVQPTALGLDDPGDDERPGAGRTGRGQARVVPARTSSSCAGRPDERNLRAPSRAQTCGLRWNCLQRYPSVGRARRPPSMIAVSGTRAP